MLRQLIALLLLPAPVLAQSIRGSIVDAATRARIPAVNVTVLDGAGRPSFSAVGTTDGQFQLALRTGAMIRVQFDRIGYLPVTSAPFALQHGQVLEVEVHLAASAVPLEPITVVARRIGDQRIADFYQRAGQSRMLGRGRIWTRNDLQKLGPVQISHVLRTVSSRASCTRSEVYLDGLPVSMRPATGFAADLAQASAVQPPPSGQPDTLPGADRPAAVSALLPAQPSGEPATSALVDWLVSPEDVEGIEIYRDSEIPAEFNPDGELCQVTLIWRKSYGEHAGTASSGAPLGALLVAAVAVLTTFLVSRVH